MIATSSLDSTVESYQYKIQSCDTLETLENLRLEILGKNGFITQQLKILGQLDPESRRHQGAVLNQAKETLSKLLQKKKQDLEEHHLSQRLAKEAVDITLPARPSTVGNIRLPRQARQQITDYFQKIGF